MLQKLTRMCFVIFGPLMFFACGIISNSDTGVDMENARSIVLQFEGVNKYIWLPDATAAKVVLSGHLKPQIQEFEGGYHKITVPGSVTVEYAGVKIYKQGEDVVVNGDFMMKNINCVIHEDGRVLMGAFIRTFN